MGLPENTGRKWKLLYFSVFILLSNIPDLPFQHWGHDRYDISHSIFINVLLMFLFILPWRFLRVNPFMAASAWCSHLLLDSFYNHGYGVKIFWPFFDKSIALPIPFFSILPDQFSAKYFKIYGIEFLFYGSILLFIFLFRRYSSPVLQPEVKGPGVDTRHLS